VENQLSPRLISLSLLFTSHQNTLQRILVRPSIFFYQDISLLMNRSRGFGFYIDLIRSFLSLTYFHKLISIHSSIALFRLAFATHSQFFDYATAKPIHSLAHDAKGTPVSSTFLLVGNLTVYSVFCFKFSFTHLNDVLFTFPSRYSSLSVTYSYLGSQMVLFTLSPSN